MARNFVIISGGPGIYEPCDKEAHDTGWSNYVDNILLLAAKGNFPKQKDEEVWWFVYKPAYEARWKDDKKKGRSSTSAIEKKGSKSYVHHLERRAKKYGWNLRWITTGSEFWSKMKTFGDKISRVWYFGHAKNDLWLSLEHSGCVASSPASSAKITVASISSHQKVLKPKMQPGGSSYDAVRSSRFYGCNTAKFAKKFSETFGVYSEGSVGKTDFSKAHSSGGKLSSLTRGCTWNKYDKKGNKV